MVLFIHVCEQENFALAKEVVRATLLVCRGTKATVGFEACFNFPERDEDRSDSLILATIH